MDSQDVEFFSLRSSSEDAPSPETVISMRGSSSEVEDISRQQEATPLVAQPAAKNHGEAKYPEIGQGPGANKQGKRLIPKPVTSDNSPSPTVHSDDKEFKRALRAVVALGKVESANSRLDLLMVEFDDTLLSSAATHANKNKKSSTSGSPAAGASAGTTDTLPLRRSLDSNDSPLLLSPFSSPTLPSKITSDTIGSLDLSQFSQQ